MPMNTRQWRFIAAEGVVMIFGGICNYFSSRLLKLPLVETRDLVLVTGTFLFLLLAITMIGAARVVVVFRKLLNWAGATSLLIATIFAAILVGIISSSVAPATISPLVIRVLFFVGSLLSVSAVVLIALKFVHDSRRLQSKVRP